MTVVALVRGVGDNTFVGQPVVAVSCDAALCRAFIKLFAAKHAGLYKSFRFTKAVDKMIVDGIRQLCDLAALEHRDNMPVLLSVQLRFKVSAEYVQILPSNQLFGLKVLFPPLGKFILINLIILRLNA